MSRIGRGYGYGGIQELAVKLCGGGNGIGQYAKFDRGVSVSLYRVEGVGVVSRGKVMEGA